MKDWRWFSIGLAVVLLLYQPLLSPILDPGLTFSYGDFTTYFGNDSAALRGQLSLQAFNNGAPSIETNRFFTLGSLCLLLEGLDLSDTQFHSALIMLLLMVGSYGVFLLVTHLDKDGHALAMPLIVFYFLNLWAIERIAHIWIWFTYALFPLFIYLGLSYIERRRGPMLVAYSLLFALFGFIPHSFIYLAMFHAVLICFALLERKPMGMVALMAILPFAVFLFVNAPAFLLAGSMDVGYPRTVTDSGLYTLSRNAELVNLFALSNNWWPQVPQDAMLSEGLFRLSSTAIIMLALTAVSLSYRRLGRDGKALTLLSMGGIAALAFVAQGMTNSLIPPIVGIISDNLGLQALGSFREWARLSILIPVLICVLFAASAQRSGHRKPIIAALTVLIVAHIAMGPVPRLLNELFSPVHFPEPYYEVDDMIVGDHKTLWLPPDRYDAVMGMSRYAWDTSKTAGAEIDGIGERYPKNLEVISEIMDQEAPPGLLDALNIRYVIRREDFLGGRFTHQDYDYLDCEGFGHLSLCVNPNATGPFRVYGGTVRISDTQEALAFPDIGMPHLAPSSNDNRSAYDLTDGSHGELRAYFVGGKEKRGSMLTFSKDISIEQGTYRLCVRGSGNSITQVGNRTISLGKAGATAHCSGPLDLMGDVVTVYADDDVQGVWIIEERYGTIDGGASLNATITGYSKAAPTRWLVNATASGPFLLGFSETYDPGWEARVFREGKRIKEVQPISLYETINGFWIDESGYLEIEMVFRPQESFEEGFPISLASLLICLGYIMVKR